MAEYLIQDSTAQGIIDKVKTKAGITDDITGSEVEDAIDSILTPTDGTIPTKTQNNLSASGKTVIVPAGYYASDANKDVATGAMGKPTFSRSGNVITATAKPSTAGYLSTSDSNSDIYTILTEKRQVTPNSYGLSVTPTNSDYLMEKVTVLGDSNLIASNIKSGVSIFGVTGSYKGKYDVSNMSGSALRVNGYTIGICFDFDITGKEISGFVRIYDINGDNAVVLFDWFNFDTYDGRNGLSLMAPDGTIYAGFMVSETEGVSNSISIYTDNIYLSRYSNSRGVICYNL